VYDNGLNFLKSRIKKNEAQERLARTREEWDRQCKQRQEERIRLLKEQQARAKEERERLRQEKLQQHVAERLPDNYEERKKAMTEELRASHERYQENIMKAEERYRERIKQLEEDLKARREQLRRTESVPRVPTKVSRDAFNTVSEFLEGDALLQQLRDANPEWEARRQAALRVSRCLSRKKLY
jgi:DNA repair exonuclease SbcCD ATPase subunit